MAKATKRTDEAYEIESLSKGLIVLEALEGMRWEPVNVATIMERTGFNRDLVDRTLKTLRLKGYAAHSYRRQYYKKRHFKFLAHEFKGCRN